VSDIGDKRAGAFVVVRLSLGMEIGLLFSIWAKRGEAIANKIVNRWRICAGLRLNPAENALRCTLLD